MANATTTYTATGSNASNNVFTDREFNDTAIDVLGTMSVTTSSPAASVTSFDAHLSTQSGSDVLTINGFAATWGGTLEVVTTSGSDVYVNGTLVGTYSFSNQDLVFNFSSANSDPDILGVLLQSVEYQNQSNHGFLSNTVSFSFGTSSGSVSAPSASIIAEPFAQSESGLVPAGSTNFLTSATATTYVGTPTTLLPSGVSALATPGTNSYSNPGLALEHLYSASFLTALVLNGGSGDQLPYETTPATEYLATAQPGNTWKFDHNGTAVGFLTQVSSGDLKYQANTISPAPYITDSGAFAYVASHITYENTSDTQPSTAQVELTVAAAPQGGVPVPSEAVPVIVTINLTPLPVVVTETATIISGGSVSGTAGETGTGALAGDSDVNAGYTLSVSAVSGGTLGSALHGAYGDLTLNADGSFSYAADATTTEAANIAAATGQVTDAFIYSVSDGHGGVSSATLDIKLDATKPSISSIAFSPSSGDLAVHASETITLALGNVGAIDIAGNGPTLTLNDGGTATYDDAASTSTSLVFDYTGAASDTDVASLAVSTVNIGGHCERRRHRGQRLAHGLEPERAADRPAAAHGSPRAAFERHLRRRRDDGSPARDQQSRHGERRHHAVAQRWRHGDARCRRHRSSAAIRPRRLRLQGRADRS